MIEEEIISKFFEKGKLLTPSALQKIKEAGIDETLFNQEGIVVDITEEKEEIKILKNLSSKPEEATTEDFIKFYTSKYEKMKKIITDRLQKDFISLNKLSASRDEVHLIGIIKDIKKQEKTILELEDMTGTIPVVFSEDIDNVELDDVIAIRGISAGKVVYGKKIIFPDIPLRQPTTGKGYVSFVSNLCLDEAPDQYIEKFFQWVENSKSSCIFIIGNIGDPKKLEENINYFKNKKFFIIEKKEDYPSIASQYSNSNIIPLSNPSIVEVNGVKILNVADFNLQMLKKRYLGKTKTILPEDYLALDIIPDIVNFAGNKQTITNYKSVTMVTSGSIMENFKPVTIDLETREVYTDEIL